MNDQREIIYEERRRVLDGENMRDAIYKMITDQCGKYCRSLCISTKISAKTGMLQELNEVTDSGYSDAASYLMKNVKSMNANELKQYAQRTGSEII